MDTNEELRKEQLREEISLIEDKINELRVETKIDIAKIEVLEQLKFDKEKELEEISSNEDIEQNKPDKGLKEELELTKEHENEDKEKDAQEEYVVERRMKDWLKKYGLELIADPALYEGGNPISEEQFLEALKENKAPVLIKDPDKANRYLNTERKWNLIKTSREAFDNAVQSINLPLESHSDGYILLERGSGDKVEISDSNNNGYIEKEESLAQSNYGDSMQNILEKSLPPELLKEYEIVRVKEELLKKDSIGSSPLSRSITDSVGIPQDVGMKNVKMVTTQMKSDLSKDRDELEEEIEKRTGIEAEEIDDMEGEIYFGDQQNNN